MKKLVLLLSLFLGLSTYSQEYQYEKEQLKKELKKKIKEEFSSDKLKGNTVKELKEKIDELNKKIKSHYNDSTKTVVYDFQKKEYETSNVIPIVGEPLVLKIKNINRLAYDVSIKSSDVAIVDEYFNDEIKTASKLSNSAGNITIVESKIIKQPILSDESFKDKKDSEIKDTEAKKIEDLKKIIIQNNSSINSLTIKKKSIEENIKSIKEKLEPLNLEILTDEIKNNEILLNEKNEKIKEFENELKNQTEEYKKNNELILNLENSNIDANNKIIELKNTTEAIQLTFNRLKESYDDILNKYVEIRNNEFDYQNYRQCILNPILNYKQYTEKIDDKDFIYYKLFKYQTNLFEFNKSIAAFNNIFYLSMNDWRTLDKLNEDSKDNLRLKYQQIKDEVDKIKNAFDELDLTNKLLKIEAIHTVLKNPKAYEIVSSPIQPFEDYVTFDVKIKHRDPNKISEYDDNREFTYMEYTQGGVRFDFSTGVVFNFGGNNNEYEIRDIAVDVNGTIQNKKQIVLTAKNDFTPMLSGMFHTSFRRNGIYSFGLTLGASINVETFQLNSLFPGLSLLIGKKQKFIITAGPAFRQVDVLKNNYSTELQYELGDFNDTSELTSKQFKIGGFIGVTYNLTQKQRGKFKINGSE